MAWRTIYIQSANSLSLNLDCLQVKYYKQKYNISLDEVQTIVIEDYKCVITARLLARLCECGINVIFTKNNKMPVGALHSLENNSRTAKYSAAQLAFTKESKRKLWQQIVAIKIELQADNLVHFNKSDSQLRIYAKEVELGDVTNREGLAARMYYQRIFGKHFIRFDDEIVNYSLNYVYQIIRSKIAQEIIDRGMHPSFGIFHHNEYNYFNLADDIIEIYRPIVDYFTVVLLQSANVEYLTPEYKEKLLEIYNQEVEIGGKKMKLVDSIPVYMNSIVDIIVGKSEKIKNHPRVKFEQI